MRAAAVLLITLAAGVAVVAVDAGSATSATPKGVVLTPAGIGQIKTGLTVAQAQRRSGRRIKLGPDAFGSGCRYASIVGLRASVMVINGIIRRIDLSPNATIRTLGGIRIGDSESDVRRAFGTRVAKTQRAYSTDGSYLTVGYASGPYRGRGIRFATNGDGTIDSIYAGRSREIRYIEGCA